MALNLITQRDFILALTGFIPMRGARESELHKCDVLTHLRNATRAGAVEFVDLQKACGMSSFDMTDVLMALVNEQMVQLTDVSNEVITNDNFLIGRSSRTLERMEKSTVRMVDSFFDELEKAKEKEPALEITASAVPTTTLVSFKEKPVKEGASMFDFDHNFNFDHRPHRIFVKAIVDYVNAPGAGNPMEVVCLEIMRNILFDFNILQPYPTGGQLSKYNLAAKIVPAAKGTDIRAALTVLEATGFLVSMHNGTQRLYGVSSVLANALMSQGYKSSYTRFASTFLGRVNFANPSEEHVRLFSAARNGLKIDATMEILTHLIDREVVEVTFDLNEMSPQEARQGYSNLEAMEQYGYITLEPLERITGPVPIVTRARYRMTKEARTLI